MMGHEIHAQLEQYFDPEPLNRLTVTKRTFPKAIRVDLQQAIADYLNADVEIDEFTGVKKEYAHYGIEFSDLLHPGQSPAVAVAPEYEEVDIGDGKSVRCVETGLWLVRVRGLRLVLLLAESRNPCGGSGIQVFAATLNSPPGEAAIRDFFSKLESAARAARSYRGKILSLEQESSYLGRSVGIKVHKLRSVSRDQVILSEKTLRLLERNILDFVRRREQLARRGMAIKKGVLFYGPPGTGKTHTIHYLSAALAGHTTFLISAEQVGLLSEYMTLARLYQPSVVVLEDVDLIARDREEMGSVCEEVLLNKLLNEMDGLKEEAEILFILTTNRPESLERALASRPGRVDQAIEFPLPDEKGREKLVRLYAHGVKIGDDLATTIVTRTHNVSAAFIKELMRRSLQFQLERSETGVLELQDVENALDELLISGGSLNLKLLGASAACGDSERHGEGRGASQ
jgi:cell division protease FtsH